MQKSAFNIPLKHQRLYKTSRTRWFVRLIFRYKYILVAFALFGIASASFVIAQSIPPADFARGAIVRIPKDMTVSEAAVLLEQKGVIRSSFLYKAYMRVIRNGKGVQAGSYLFDQPQSAVRVAYRMAYGIDELQKIKVVIPEGSSSRNIAAIIKRAIPSFDAKSFLSEAQKYEGYLFPETYFFNPDVSPSEVISEMRTQFEEKVTALMGAIATSTHALENVVVLASILEEEANNTDDRRMISGVLWNRINIGMPLQVDAPFYYLLGKTSSQLTLSDLATTSPYNTYKNKGLPPAAISNPGLDAIRAALNPVPSKYLFYLADQTGVTHYATTHDEHVENKWKFLR
ncbi:MAG: endolytic transglycosylase MltG [Patescibacteria group bacterium]